MTRKPKYYFTLRLGKDGKVYEILVERRRSKFLGMKVFLTPHVDPKGQISPLMFWEWRWNLTRVSRSVA